MTWKTMAIVHVTIAIPVEELSSGWGMHAVAEEAKTIALRRARAHCAELGTIQTVRVTAVMTEGEPEDVKET